MSGLGQLFDSYGRVARLYPAILVAGPAIILFVFAAPAILETLGESAALGIAALALVYFLSSVARSRGKRIEQVLTRRWGGWSTTAVLRHSDQTFDGMTKRRYHAALQGICPDLIIPNAITEATDPKSADETYRSVTKKLIEQRRDDRWSLVHLENGSYGFRRNLLGMKWIAVSISFALAVLTAVYWWLQSGTPSSLRAGMAIFAVWPGPILLVIFDLLVIIPWLVVVTPNWVRQASYDYAIALFRTLD